MAQINPYEDDYNEGPYAQEPYEPDYSGIEAAYKKYLGRKGSQDEYAFHAKTSPTNYDAAIKNSSEAQQWAARGSQPTSAPTSFVAERAAIAAHPENAFGNTGLEQQIRNIWHATPDHSPENLARLAAEFGVKTGGRYGDTLILPDGRVIDAIEDVGGRNGGGWIDTSQADGVSRGSQAIGQRSGGIGGGSSRSGGSSVGSTVASSSTTQDQALRQALIDQLTKRSQQSLAVDRNDPTLRAQADPYTAQIERQRRNYLADMAESQGPLANLQGEARLSQERAGQASGLFEAQLIGREIESRRQEISEALQSLQGLLTTGQEMSLRKELAQLDDATKRLGLNQQNAQFDKNLGFDIGRADMDFFLRGQGL